METALCVVCVVLMSMLVFPPGQLPATTHWAYLPRAARPPVPSGGPPANFFLPNDPAGIVTTGLPQIAIDPNGGVHTMYAAGTPDGTGTRPAYYAYCPANCTGVVNFTTVSMGDLMSHAQLALTPVGHPRVLLN